MSRSQGKWTLAWKGIAPSCLARSGVAPEVNRPCLSFNMTTLTPRPSPTGAGMMTPAASEECHDERIEVASATQRWCCHLERASR